MSSQRISKTKFSGINIEFLSKLFIQILILEGDSRCNQEGEQKVCNTN